MVFSSLEFVFFFLPLSLLAYLIVPAALRNTVLLVSSLCFYAWGAQLFVFILLASIAANYCLGLLADSAVNAVGKRPSQQRQIAIWASVFSNLALLGYFKYANFFVTELSPVLVKLGIDSPHWVEIALPIGISFFTFQSMSYVLDIAQGRSRALRNPIDFAMYVALFPQLIAGPIVRFHVIEAQLRARNIDVTGMAEGFMRFGYGLCKKVLVADPAGAVAEAVFDAPAGSLTTSMAWLGAISYTIQIYFDFSAYSDMAIGLGRLFGFKFPENFNNPYSATSVTDFWRRWHITLSQWFRDYVYIPLGGSRTRPSRMYTNLAIVFLLTGIWHGASWTFIAWGAYHGALLVIERVSGLRDAPVARSRLVGRRALTLLLVILGWVLFRAINFDQALEFYHKMFVFHGMTLSSAVTVALSNKNTLVLALSMLVFVLPGNWSGYQWLTGLPRAHDNTRPLRRLWWLKPCLLLFILFPYAVAQMASGTFSPFLYFRF